MSNGSNGNGGNNKSSRQILGRNDPSKFARDPFIKVEFRRRLAICMRHKKVNASQLARATGLSPTVIGRHLKGDILANEASVIRYCTFFGVTDSWLYGIEALTDAPFEIDKLVREVQDIQKARATQTTRGDGKPRAALEPTAPLKTSLWTRQKLATTRHMEELIEKNSVTSPTVIPIRDPFLAIVSVPDAKWEGTGLWPQARNASGDTFRAQLDEYVRLSNSTRLQKKLLASNITERTYFLGSQDPTKELQVCTGIPLATIENIWKGYQYPSKKNLFLIAAALKTTPEALEEGVRTLLGAKSGSAGRSYRKLHPDTQALIPEPPPVDGTMDERILFMSYLGYLADKEGPDSNVMGEYYDWFEILGMRTEEPNHPTFPMYENANERDPDQELNFFVQNYMDEIRLGNIKKPRGM